DGGRRIRLGFLSAYFHPHTISLLMGGLIAQLSRQDFEVTVLALGCQEDDVSPFIRQHADRFSVVPTYLPSARALIANHHLDVLFYTDIGMEPVSYTLALSRLASVQLTTWGHPLTSGMDTIDYFISSEDLDTNQGSQHYTEKLIRPKALPIYYFR